MLRFGCHLSRRPRRWHDDERSSLVGQIGAHSRIDDLFHRLLQRGDEAIGVRGRKRIPLLGLLRRQGPEPVDDPYLRQPAP